MKNANMIALFLATCLLVKTTQGQTQRPRVLILGDSIYQPIGRSLTSELKDKVEVVTPAIQPGEIRNSSTALENIDQWVGTAKWDLIHLTYRTRRSYLPSTWTEVLPRDGERCRWYSSDQAPRLRKQLARIS